jgi:hypothetical protein
MPVLLMLCGSAGAGNFYVSGDAGLADPRESSFDHATAYNVSAGYLFENLGLEVSAIDLDKIDYNNLADSYIEISGYTAHVFWRQKFNRVLGVDFGAGLFNWDAEATLLGNDAGKDSDTSVYLDIRLITEFGDTFGAFVATRYLADVSGSDIATLSLGAVIKF